jgi:hypothetical protein
MNMERKTPNPQFTTRLGCLSMSIRNSPLFGS